MNILCWVTASLFSINGLLAQTITVIKYASPRHEKSYSHKTDKKTRYILHCWDQNNSCHWKHVSEKLNDFSPKDINDWVLNEIENGKKKGKTLYKNAVYVKWTKNKIIMSNKPI